MIHFDARFCLGFDICGSCLITYTGTFRDDNSALLIVLHMSAHRRVYYFYHTAIRYFAYAAPFIDARWSQFFTAWPAAARYTGAATGFPSPALAARSCSVVASVLAAYASNVARQRKAQLEVAGDDFHYSLPLK